jgi:hypothetical protein
MTAQTVAVRVRVIPGHATAVDEAPPREDEGVPPLDWAGTLRERAAFRDWAWPVGSWAFLAVSSPAVWFASGSFPVLVGYSLSVAIPAMAWDSWLTRHTRRWRVKPVWPGRDGRTVAVGGSHGAQEEG